MRSVLFVDPPAFCTSLEGLVAPALRTRPLAVAPAGADQATILALSAEARQAGLKRGMPVRIAQRRCPDLIVLPPNPRLYAQASRALHKILRIYAPTIEPRGYGHAFLDLTGTVRLFGPPQDVAARIRREVRKQLQLAVSVGVATNKLVSQAAIRVDRLAPSGRNLEDQQLYVPAGDERCFLSPQPLEVLPELEPRVRAQLQDYQLDLIGEVAAIPESALCAVFGGHGRLLRARARGIDPRPVLPPERQSEFHVSHTLTTDTNDLGILFPLLRLLTERLGSRLRKRRLIAYRLLVETTYADYTTSSRTVSLSAAALDGELTDAARRAFVRANTKRLAVRTVALTLDRVMEEEAQLELWEGQWDSGSAGQQQHTNARLYSDPSSVIVPLSRCPAALQHAVDHIRTRYGAGALRTVPLGGHRSSRTAHHQTTTIFPNVALPSMTRCASGS
jgi:DNA polymerase-4